jgi:hypothetical protein
VSDEDAPQSGAGGGAFRSILSKVGWISFGIVLTLVITTLPERIDVPFLSDPPPIEEQLSDIASDAALSGRFPAVTKPVELQVSGTESYLMVLRDSEFQTFPGPTAASDEVRIYDLVDDELQLRFSFTPDPSTTGSLAGAKPLMVFLLERVTNLDAEPGSEILGAFSPFAMLPEFPIPVEIDWADSETGYRISGLVPKRPQVAGSGPRGLGATTFSVSTSRNGV